MEFLLIHHDEDDVAQCSSRQLSASQQSERTSLKLVLDSLDRFVILPKRPTILKCKPMPSDSVSCMPFRSLKGVNRGKGDILPAYTATLECRQSQRLVGLLLIAGCLEGWSNARRPSTKSKSGAPKANRRPGATSNRGRLSSLLLPGCA